MTTTTTRGQHSVAPEIEGRILAELAAGASVQQLCQNPNWRIDDIAAVLRDKNLAVDETTGSIVRAKAGGNDDPVLVLLTFAESRYIREHARQVLAARTTLLEALAERQESVETAQSQQLVLAAHNTYIDFLRREMDAAIRRTRKLPTGTGGGK